MKVQKTQSFGVITDVTSPKSYQNGVPNDGRENAIVWFRFVGSDTNNTNIAEKSDVALFASSVMGANVSHCVADLSGAIYPDNCNTYQQKLSHAKSVLQHQKVLFTKYSLSVVDYLAETHDGKTELYSADGTQIHQISRCYLGAYDDEENALQTLLRHVNARLQDGRYTLTKPTQSAVGQVAAV